MRWLVTATVACIVACAALIAIGGADVVIFLGIALGGVAFVLVLSIAFYAVGRSEDRERAEREERLAGMDGPAT
jgi:ABC-type transport system involved in cytochrome bd biosynthesis fused ATPase/permease subunit